MKPKAVLVTGSRDWTDKDTIATAICAALEGRDETLVIHGACRGADQIADAVAGANGFAVLRMPAQWERNGVRDMKAGTRRNEFMLDVVCSLANCGWEVEVLAFMLPESRGTKHMRRISRACGLKVTDFGAHDWELA